MSGGSKEQTVGYKVYLGMQAVLVHGPVDYLLKLLWDGRVAWTGLSTGGSITINKPGLFGDEEREGGIVGTIDFEQGGPEQGENDYLQSQMGSAIPAFRGVAQLVMRQLYWGMNPYLKKFSAWLQRIHVTTDGEVQWYDEKAEISAAIASLNSPWLYKTLPYHANPGYEQLDPPTEWDGETTLPIGGAPAWPFPTPGGWPTPGLSVLWIKKTVYNVPAGLVVKLGADNGCVMFVNGEYVGGSNRDNDDIGSNQNNPVSFTIPATGTYEILLKAFTESSTSTQSGNALAMTLEAVPGGGDMNPSHIIRECLTSPDWGMGYTADDMDDTYFMAAADQLYDEGFGLSILWDRQMPIEDFVKLVLKHIGGLCDISYAGDNPTGKFRLKLIRDDYDVGTLPVLGPSEIEKVEGHTYQAAGEFVNSVTVQYWDAATGKDASITESDSALVAMQGSVVNTTVQYNGITNKELATRVALRDLLSLSTPLHSMTAYVPLEYLGTLETGDVFVMNWPEHKIEGVVMRIMKMHRGDGKNPTCRLILSQDIYGLPDSGTITVPDTGWVDPIGDPEAMTVRKAVEAPYYELVQRAGQGTVDSELSANPEAGYVLASGARPGTAINARMLTDAGAGYEAVGTVDFCPVLELTADTTLLDTVWTVSDVSDADSITVGMHGQVGNELIKVVDKTGTALTVGRAVLDTVPGLHVIGDKIIFWDAAAGLDQTQYVLSEEVNVKLLPITGSGTLDEASAPVDTVTIEQRAFRPYPPGNVKFNDEYFPAEINTDCSVSFATRNRQQQTGADLVDWFAGDVTQEAGVVTHIELYDNDTDTLIYSDSSATSPIVVPSAEMVYNNRIEVFSVRDSVESLFRVIHTFNSGFTIEGGMPGGALQETYSYQLTITGGTAPFSYALASGDSLPAGLSLNASTGEITGIPTATGYTTFTIEVTDDLGRFQSKEFTIGVGTIKTLVPFNGTVGSTSFPDSTGRTWTRSGNVVIQADAEAFNGVAGRFDGSGDYLTAADSADWAFGTDDWTFDVFVKMGEIVPSGWFESLMAQRNGSTNQNAWTFYIANPNRSFCQVTSGGTQTGAPSIASPTPDYDIAVGERVHYAVTRKGGRLYMHLNGVLVTATDLPGGAAFSVYNSSALVRIGAFDSGPYANSYLDAWLDQLRFTRGAARYNEEDFTPPTAPSDYPTP